MGKNNLLPIATVRAFIEREGRNPDEYKILSRERDLIIIRHVLAGDTFAWTTVKTWQRLTNIITITN